MYEKAHWKDQRIARFIIDEALQRGWAISIYDGEMWVVKMCREKDRLLNEILNTESDELVFRDHTNRQIGWMRLIWVNQGEALNDFSIDNVDFVQFADEVVGVFVESLMGLEYDDRQARQEAPVAQVSTESTSVGEGEGEASGT